MFLLSLKAPHLNLSIMCVSGVEFHLESEIIFCQYSCIQTMPNLIPCCLAKDSFNINKVLNTSAKLLFCSLQRRLENWMLQSLNYHGLCGKMTKSFSEYSSVISIASSCNDDIAYVWHLKYIIML